MFGGALRTLTDPADEVVDGEPVLEESGRLRVVTDEHDASVPSTSGARALVPAADSVVARAAVAGFVAGAATLALAHRRGARRLARAAARSPRRGADALPIVGTRSFLIDIHLIDKPGR